MRRRMLAIGAIGAAVLLAYALTSACGGGSPAGTLATDDPTDAVATTDPGADATTEVDPTPTTRPKGTETIDEADGPRPPAAALAPTRAGAKSFARFYVEQLSIGYGYGDVTGMRAYSTDACGLCRDYADEYETIARNGGWVRGDPTWRVDTVAIERFDVERSEVAVALTIGEHSYADSAIDPEQDAPERSYAFAFDLHHDGRQWLVTAATAANA